MRALNSARLWPLPQQRWSAPTSGPSYKAHSVLPQHAMKASYRSAFARETDSFAPTLDNIADIGQKPCIRNPTKRSLCPSRSISGLGGQVEFCFIAPDNGGVWAMFNHPTFKLLAYFIGAGIFAYALFMARVMGSSIRLKWYLIGSVKRWIRWQKAFGSR